MRFSWSSGGDEGWAFGPPMAVCSDEVVEKDVNVSLVYNRALMMRPKNVTPLGSQESVHGLRIGADVNVEGPG